MLKREISVEEFEDTISSIEDIREPIILKRKNKKDLVVISLEEYQKTVFLSKMEKSKEQYKRGKVHSARKVFKELRNKYVSMGNTAKRLMNKIEENILILEKNPYLCRETHVKPHNVIYRRLVVDNYVVLYKVEEDHKQVIIYRALYGKRDYLIVED